MYIISSKQKTSEVELVVDNINVRSAIVHYNMPEHVAQLLLNMLAVCNQPIRNAKVFLNFLIFRLHRCGFAGEHPLILRNFLRKFSSSYSDFNKVITYSKDCVCN